MTRERPVQNVDLTTKWSPRMARVQRLRSGPGSPRRSPVGATVLPMMSKREVYGLIPYQLVSVDILRNKVGYFKLSTFTTIGVSTKSLYLHTLFSATTVKSLGNLDHLIFLIHLLHLWRFWSILSLALLVSHDNLHKSVAVFSDLVVFGLQMQFSHHGVDLDFS